MKKMEPSLEESYAKKESKQPFLEEDAIEEMEKRSQCLG